MERIRSDDEAALTELMTLYRAALTAYALRTARAFDAAEDVVQETFVRLWQHRKRWRPGGSVQAFLYKTARNIVLGSARSLEVRRRTEPQIREALEPVQKSPLDLAADEEVRRLVAAALERLPTRRRTALLLVRLSGYSLDEAAASMNVSRQTVANHVSLALSDLEVALRPYLL